MVNRICVYAIAKNESQNVDKWYESMKEADEIVVLDTGSTDDTVDKLKAHGVIVGQTSYDLFRFDVARNDSLKLVPDNCNIRFAVDLDEIIDPGWADLIRNEWVGGVHTRADYSVVMRDESFDRTMNWVHSKDWRWKYPCHEAMTREGGIWYQPEELLDLRGRLILRHYPDVGKGRRSYLDLLNIRWAENPKESASHVYLIRELGYQEMWESVISQEPVVRSGIDDWYGKVDLCAALSYIGDAYCELGRIREGVARYFEAIQAYDGGRYPYIKLAAKLIDLGKAGIAKAILLQCLKDTRRVPFWTWLETESHWSWEIYDWLCVACYYTGEYKEAVYYANRALDLCPGNEHIMSNLKISLRKEIENA